MNTSIEVRDADYLRAVFVGTLHGLIKRHQWNAQQAAKALGASEIHAVQLIQGKGHDFPMEVLADMVFFSGVEVGITIGLPRGTPSLSV